MYDMLFVFNRRIVLHTRYDNVYIDIVVILSLYDGLFKAITTDIIVITIVNIFNSVNILVKIVVVSTSISLVFISPIIL